MVGFVLLLLLTFIFLLLLALSFLLLLLAFIFFVVVIGIHLFVTIGIYPVFIIGILYKISRQSTFVCLARSCRFSFKNCSTLHAITEDPVPRVDGWEMGNIVNL